MTFALPRLYDVNEIGIGHYNRTPSTAGYDSIDEITIKYLDENNAW